MKEHDVTTARLQEHIADAEITVLGITECPLCDSKGSEDSPDLVEHVLQHIHDFSLRSLPWPSDPVIQSRKRAGLFDINHARKTVKDREGNEHTFDIAGWASTTDPSFGLRDGPMALGGLNETQNNLQGSSTRPSLQLCKYDLSPRETEPEEMIASNRTGNDYFSKHQYFRDASSDGNFSSQVYHMSQTSRNDTQLSARNLPKRWKCSICDLQEGKGKDAFFDHLKKRHKIDQQEIENQEKDIEQWKAEMLGTSFWNGLHVYHLILCPAWAWMSD